MLILLFFSSNTDLCLQSGSQVDYRQASADLHSIIYSSVLALLASIHLQILCATAQPCGDHLWPCANSGSCCGSGALRWSSRSSCAALGLDPCWLASHFFVSSLAFLSSRGVGGSRRPFPPALPRRHSSGCQSTSPTP